MLDALRFDYAGSDGVPVTYPPVGGLGGFHHTFYLEDDEYLIGISGRCGWYVDSIRLHTNKRVSESYGGEGGERDYALMAPAGYEIAGLYGRSDWYIDALGVWLRPVALREELAEGAALLAEVEAERTAAAAEAELDEIIDAVAAEIAAEGEARRRAGLESRGDALLEVVSDPEAMGGELLSAEESAALEAAALEELVAALEEEIEAEQLAVQEEDTLDMAIVSYSAAVGSTSDLDSLAAEAALEAIATLEDMEPGQEETVDLGIDARVDIDPATGLAYATVTAIASEVEDPSLTEVSWLEWTDQEGEPLDAVVVLRRASVDSEAAVEGLEETAVAEAIAVLRGEESGEGTVDVAVYTQIDDAAGGGGVATVMAVAAPATETGPEGDGDESAVMVVDAIDHEEELFDLEQEAVEAAMLALEEDLGQELDDADVTVYTGVTEDENGQTYGAVVAVASRRADPPADAFRSATGRGSRGPSAVQLTGTEQRPQDLQLIEGIGPKIAALLIEHGINDLGQLAETPVERLRTILGGAGKRFRLADPATWPRQAVLAAAGDWGALTELQAQLRAGRQATG